MPLEEKEIEEQNKAIATAETAAQNDPTNFEAHMALGMAYFHAAQLEKALAAFQKASELNPTDYAAFSWIGRVYEHLGQPQKSIEANKHAISLDPQAIAPYIGLGIIYFDQLNDYEAAVEAFQTGLAHHPQDMFATALLGITFARLGRFAEAKTALQRAITLHPENTFALGNLSIIYLHLQQYDEMVATCQQEIAITDGHDARRMLGYVYAHLGRYDEAVHQLERAMTLEPRDYEAQAALARAYRVVGRGQESAEQYALAYESAYQDNEYGQACFEAVSGNFKQALKLLEIALKKGQVQPSWARIDPEFAFMTDNPRFKTLLQE